MIDLHGISEVKETTNSEDVNELLKLGWILLSTESYKYPNLIAGFNYGHSYSLGWPRSLGNPKHLSEQKIEH